MLSKCSIFLPLKLSSCIWSSLFFSSSTACIYLSTSEHKPLHILFTFLCPRSSLTTLPELEFWCLRTGSLSGNTPLFKSRKFISQIGFELTTSRTEEGLYRLSYRRFQLWIEKKKQRILGLPCSSRLLSCHHVLNISCRSFRYKYLKERHYLNRRFKFVFMTHAMLISVHM